MLFSPIHTQREEGTSNSEFSVASSIEFQQLADLQHVKNVLTHISNLAAPATGNSTFNRLKHDEKHTQSLQIFTVWSYKPPEHSPSVVYFSVAPQKKTKNGTLLFEHPHMKNPVRKNFPIQKNSIKILASEKFFQVRKISKIWCQRKFSQTKKNCNQNETER